MSQPNEYLKSLDLQPRRVLVIAAHPGDIEFGPVAAIAKWIKQGAEAMYLVATRGELSLPGVEPEDAALIRSGEQSAAAAAIGVHTVDFLDVDDGTVEPSVSLRRAIVRDIRRFRPDLLITMNHREQELDGSLNDADHRAVGIAALDAVRAAANQWAFRDVGRPHVVDVVLVAASPSSTHAIDVSGFEVDAVRAFSAHEQHLASVADHPMASSSWLTSVDAIAVERIEYAQGRPCHSFVVKEFADADGQLQIRKLSEDSDSTKTSGRARDAVSSTRPSKQASRSSKRKPKKTTPSAVAAMKLKVRLEKRGRSIGVEVPASAMERLGTGKRPGATIEINDTVFETTVGTNDGRPFIAINADRRKAAGIEVDNTFFLALSPSGDAAAPEAPATPVEVEVEVEPPAETVKSGRPKRNRRKRSSGSRSRSSRSAT